MKLEKPIIFFDLESTGVGTEIARIVQIAAIKINPDGTREQKDILINPEIEIPLEASEVHGITNEIVKDKPTFKQLSVSMRAWFKDCDLAGYNSNNYDVPLLSREFERVGLEGIDWNPSLFDVFQLYRNLFPNTLSDVYERLTGKILDGAHNALFDVVATEEIANILMPKLEDSIKTPKDVDEYLQGDKKRFDLSGKLYVDLEGIVRYNFGKDKDKSVVDNPGFAEWMLKNTFPQETKNKIKELLKRKVNE